MVRCVVDLLCYLLGRALIDSGEFLYYATYVGALVALASEGGGGKIGGVCLDDEAGE